MRRLIFFRTFILLFKGANTLSSFLESALQWQALSSVIPINVRMHKTHQSCTVHATATQLAMESSIVALFTDQRRLDLFRKWAQTTFYFAIELALDKFRACNLEKYTNSARGGSKASADTRRGPMRVETHAVCWVAAAWDRCDSPILNYLSRVVSIYLLLK